MPTADDIGSHGEFVAQMLLSDPFGRNRPYFRPHLLGAKSPTFDLMVELVDPGVIFSFLLVQVRSTKKGYWGEKNAPRLKVKMSSEEVQCLARCPAPTYFIGIDVGQQQGFLLGIEGARKGPISSLTTRFPLNQATLERLWFEVREFWQRQGANQKTTSFTDEGE